MIPDLHEIYAVAVWQECGVIEVKALLLPHDPVPVAKIKVKNAARCNKRVHLLENARDLAVRHIGKRVAGAHHAVECSVEMCCQSAKITLPQIDGKTAFGCLFPAACKHRFAQIRSVERNAKRRKRQCEGACADAHVERSAHGETGKNGFPVRLRHVIFFGRVEEIVDIAAVIYAGHGTTTS